jgi:hypothetical protein
MGEFVAWVTGVTKKILGGLANGHKTLSISNIDVLRKGADRSSDEESAL